MIGKVLKGKSFKGCVSYVMGKENATLIDSEGVLDIDTQSIINSFYLQSLMNPKLAKSVGHIPLSYAKEDEDKLTDNKMMVQLAKEYMQMMKIENTQYIIVRHNDTEHPHCHIIFNRVDNEGKTISDKNDYARNERVTKALKEKYGLTFGKGKEQVNTQKLNDPDKVKYEIYTAIKTALRQSPDWIQFHSELKKQRINIRFKYKGKTGEVQGISFKKGDYSFKGSEIDRSFSYSKLNNLLKQNQYNNQKQNTDNPQKQSQNAHSPDFVLNIATGSIQQHREDDALENEFTNRMQSEEKERQFNSKKKKKQKYRRGL
ncbi:MAG: relaxase/mobilization nuclease domain-containing protein [Dysgonomonas sp.]